MPTSIFGRSCAAAGSAKPNIITVNTDKPTFRMDALTIPPVAACSFMNRFAPRPGGRRLTPNNVNESRRQWKRFFRFRGGQGQIWAESPFYWRFRHALATAQDRVRAAFRWVDRTRGLLRVAALVRLKG